MANYGSSKSESEALSCILGSISKESCRLPGSGFKNITKSAIADNVFFCEIGHDSPTIFNPIPAAITATDRVNSIDEEI